jgi:hypothetical protein
MSKYIFGYHGRAVTPETAQQDQAVMAAWQQWFRNMGPALVDIGNPAGPSQVIDPNGSVSKPQGVGLTGYSIVEAETIESAMTLAQGCPIFAAGGSIEVAELMPM